MARRLAGRKPGGSKRRGHPAAGTSARLMILPRRGAGAAPPDCYLDHKLSRLKTCAPCLALPQRTPAATRSRQKNGAGRAKKRPPPWWPLRRHRAKHRANRLPAPPLDPSHPTAGAPRAARKPLMKMWLLRAARPRPRRAPIPPQPTPAKHPARRACGRHAMSTISAAPPDSISPVTP